MPLLGGLGLCLLAAAIVRPCLTGENCSNIELYIVVNDTMNEIFDIVGRNCEGQCTCVGIHDFCITSMK